MLVSPKNNAALPTVMSGVPTTLTTEVMMSASLKVPHVAQLENKSVMRMDNKFADTLAAKTQ